VWFVAAQLVMRACGYAEFQALGMTPVSRFASMGSSTGGIAVYALTHPHVIPGRLLREPLFLLILCSGIFCLIDWRTVWVGVLGAAAFMATDDVIIGRLDYIYSYASFPFLLYSSARGARWLLDRSPGRPVLHRGLDAC